LPPEDRSEILGDLDEQFVQHVHRRDAVGRPQRELGIRTALGATPAMLRRSVSGEALSIAGLGVAIGGVGAWLRRGLPSVTYRVSALDLLAWVAMIFIVTLTTLVAPILCGHRPRHVYTEPHCSRRTIVRAIYQ
jgi:hypothetical protein